MTFLGVLGVLVIVQVAVLVARFCIVGPARTKHLPGKAGHL